MNKILITRPNYDDTTRYLFSWSKKIISLAELKNIQVLDLAKERANKEEISSMLLKMKPRFVFFNGHGSSDCITGHNNEILIQAGINEYLLEDKIVYALSCKSAKVLGVKSIESGAVSYVGYSDDFIFMFDPSKISKPIEDKLAGLFLEPANQFAVSLIKGNSAGDSHKRSKSAFKDNLENLLTSETSSENTSALRYLFWNMKHLVCFGSQSAVL